VIDFFLGIVVGGSTASLFFFRGMSFWILYARVLALAALPALAWLGHKAATAQSAWWSSPASVALLAGIVGAIAPLTAFIGSWAKIQLDAQRQRHDMAQAKAKQAHDINDARVKQEHQITTDYLSRTLSSELPLATRHQLLRFLTTDPANPARLQAWARAELRRIDSQYEQLTKDVQAVHDEIAGAKDVEALRLAERKLKAISTRAASAAGKPPLPEVSIEALRAGVFAHEDLGELKFRGAALRDVVLSMCKFSGSDFEGADLTDSSLGQVSATLCNFNSANLSGANMWKGDFRGSTMVGATLSQADLRQARLDGVDLSGATLDAEDVQAIYDAATKWPAGFDAKRAGCILVASHEPAEEALDG
jgi:uncharacterized protein YjbI with pentapeptide repeats